MKKLLRIALVIIVLTLGGSAAYTQTVGGPAGPLLGRTHLWLKIGQVDIGGEAARAWGIDREGYVAFEIYRANRREFYSGVELGHFGAGRTTAADGDTIRDLDFLWLELNEKKAFDLKRGLTIDAGLGIALFYVGGEEVSMVGMEEVTDPLADFGLGAQLFTDFTWRRGRFLLGLDVKYQWAFDAVNVDYSNLRLGAHAGVAF